MTKKATKRTGIRVTIAGPKGEDLHFDYPNATGWGIDQTGTLGVGEPTAREDANGNPIQETIAAFSEWRRVAWMTRKA